MITNDQILQVARECGYDSGQTVEMNDVGLITFARRIQQMQIEVDAGICTSFRMLDQQAYTQDGYTALKACAAAIREQSDEN